MKISQIQSQRSRLRVSLAALALVGRQLKIPLRPGGAVVTQVRNPAFRFQDLARTEAILTSAAGTATSQ